MHPASHNSESNLFRERVNTRLKISFERAGGACVFVTITQVHIAKPDTNAICEVTMAASSPLLR